MWPIYIVLMDFQYNVLSWVTDALRKPVNLQTIYQTDRSSWWNSLGTALTFYFLGGIDYWVFTNHIQVTGIWQSQSLKKSKVHQIHTNIPKLLYKKINQLHANASKQDHECERTRTKATWHQIYEKKGVGYSTIVCEQERLCPTCIKIELDRSDTNSLSHAKSFPGISHPNVLASSYTCRVVTFTNLPHSNKLKKWARKRSTPHSTSSCSKKKKERKSNQPNYKELLVVLSCCITC